MQMADGSNKAEPPKGAKAQGAGVGPRGLLKEGGTNMATLRWDPFREFGGNWLPPVDIYSTGEHELVIKAEVPGMNKEDLDITVENFTLTIRGEKKAEQTVKDDQFHRVERSYGTFTRSFALPHTVDSNKVVAEYRDGVLTVKLPLREEAK